MSRHTPIAIALLIALHAAGCQSFSSTLLKRHPDNSFAGNSNGISGLHGQARPFQGIPVALEVPTHVDIEIVETYYIEQVTVNGEKFLREVSFRPDRPRNLDVIAHPIKTKKVFTVDFVRPAAGTLTTGMEFTANQYFSSIKNRIEDKTIQDVTESISKLAPLLTKKTAAVVGAEVKNQVVVNTRTVAYERFDIDDPEFEGLVYAFVERHLNGCHACHAPKELKTEAATGVQPAVAPAPGRTRIQVRDEHAAVDAASSLCPVGRSSAERQRVLLQTADYVVYRGR